jgi:hypothetical protein
MTYGLGAFPSPPDGRDHVLTASAIQSAAAGLVIPDRFLIPGMPPHLDQNGTPHCTAYAGNQLKRWQEKKDGHGVRVYDHGRMYSWQKQVDGINGEGSTGRAWCEIARTRGIPLLGGGGRAVDRIAGYWRVDVAGDWDALFAAILVFGPVMWGREFYRSWFRPVNGIVPKPGGGMVGGHEGLIVGWDKKHPTVKGPAILDWGSWGNYAGSTGGGNAWVPTKYLSTSHQSGKAQVWEMWKAKDIVGD